ncbi:ankyrin repeat-containing domain protein [Kockovaella imperatae]|uniref:Ankyrin repeat-containing domain protein n=1 Tax=Kockovaella imperatae TaxID=4999 RepID=A0A1Y1UDD8_9TREE|nr:ankyrin repeat-containing domain protein [Kockovaella imperatae]ORX36043.1 ankyrin repeat-containing domain protein [Kockovaella imperatae]
MTSLGRARLPSSMENGPTMHITRNPAIRIRQAVRDNNVPLLARLQHKTDLRNTDRNRLTSLSWSAIDGSLEVFEWLLLDYGHDDQELSRDADNNTILHLLASVPSPPGLSPHNHLIESFSFSLRSTTRPISEQIAICLRMTHLYHTVFPFILDWSNSGGKTALHLAAQAGNSQFVNTLCDFGADIDLTDLQGNSPLHYASAWGHIETIKVLLDRGCPHNVKNVDGFTAADFAYSHTVKAALEAGVREIYDGKRNRRKAEIISNEIMNPLTEPRMRSGSTSTGRSGSRQPSSQPIMRRESEPNSKRPEVLPLTIDTRIPRPFPGRSPSLPVSSHPKSPPPPLPGPQVIGIPTSQGPPQSLPMRRANSAQTGSSASEGSRRARGTPI